MKTYAPDRSRLIPPRAGGKRRKWKKLRAHAIQIVTNNRGLTLCPESITVWIGVIYGIMQGERKRASR